MVIDELAETLRKRAFEALLVVSPADVNSWKTHPCTAALIKLIQSGYTEKYVQWGNGSFTHETAEGTDQQNAQALGVCEGLEQAEAFIQDIQELIEEAKEEYANDYTQGA